MQHSVQHFSPHPREHSAAVAALLIENVTEKHVTGKTAQPMLGPFRPPKGILKMATIDLRTDAARREFGLEDTTVSGPSQRGKNGDSHRSRAEALTLIVDVLKHAARPMTRLQIARAIHRAKTPYLVGVINELVESGDLSETARVRPNGAIEYLYTWGG